MIGTVSLSVQRKLGTAQSQALAAGVEGGPGTEKGSSKGSKTSTGVLVG
jgi:hypothetical protein